MTDDNYLKARDEANKVQAIRENHAASPYHVNSLRAFAEGADWSRSFTRAEILNSDEVKALIEAIACIYPCKTTLGDVRTVKNKPMPLCKACDALTNFNKRFGGGE